MLFALGISIFLLALNANAYTQHLSAAEMKQEIDSKVVYYGSSIRLQNIQAKFNMHSYDLRYSSGSNQQSITCVNSNRDDNSLWMVKSAHGEPIKHHTEAVKCGDTIRLEHTGTQKNLHSHDFIAAMSGKYEVSGYGENGNGDKSDDWVILCNNQEEGSILLGSSIFDLKHVVTGRYLYTDTRYMFNQQNCGYNCPTFGQLEVSADRYVSSGTKWKISSGFFFIMTNDDDYYNDSDSETGGRDQNPGGDEL